MVAQARPVAVSVERQVSVIFRGENSQDLVMGPGGDAEARGSLTPRKRNLSLVQKQVSHKG